MIKRYFLFVVAMLSVVSIFADPVTKSNARQKAQQFLQSQGKSVKSEPAKAPSLGGGVSLQETAAYYVFNTTGNDGFVIVSGDDAIDDILGYSFNGSFDEENMPDNLKAWLEGYTEQIEMIAAGKALPARVPIHSASIGTRMTTTWNQSAPYNNQCVFDGYACATGCVATAVAQVMNWNQWPQTATPAIQGYTTEKYKFVLDDLPSTTFDWANMANDYESGSTSSEQQEAVATLMRYVGQSVEMNYGPSSGASYYKVIYALSHYFGYSPTITYEKAAAYTITQWDNKVYNELLQRPVLYDGSSTDVGHAFVIDGYDSSNGMYYVNWGWGGGSNGWYRLRLMDATGTGIGGSATGDGYANGQGAVFGMKPDDGSTITTERYLIGHQGLFISYSTEVPCGSMSSYYYNPYNEALHFDTGLAMLNDAGDIINVFDIAEDVEKDNIGFYYGGYYPDPNYGMEAGNTYKFAFVSRETGNTEWHKAFPDIKYFEVRFTNYDDYQIIVHPVANLVATSTDVTGENRVNNTSTFNVSLLNNGEEFDNSVYVLAKGPNDDDYSIIGRTGLAIEAGESSGVSFPFTPDAAGTYYLRLAYDASGTNVITETSVEIRKAKMDVVSLTYGYDGDNLNIEFENNNDVTYPYRFVIQLYIASNGSLVSYVGQYNSEYSYANFIESNTTKTIPFAVGSLSPGEYCARIWYNPEFTQEWNMYVLKNVFFTVDDDGKTTVGISGTPYIKNGQRTSDGAVYDLTGRKLNGKPTKKGIYIIDGKAVVVK